MTPDPPDDVRHGSHVLMNDDMRITSNYGKRFLGAVLCLASVLKGITNLGDMDSGVSRWFMLAGACAELVIGAGLMFRWKPALVEPAGALLFVFLAAISGIGTIRGVASCGCFGSLALPPWLVFSFDLISCAGLLWGMDRGAGEIARRNGLLPAAAVVSLCLGLGLATGLAIYPHLGPVTQVCIPRPSRPRIPWWLTRPSSRIVRFPSSPISGSTPT